MVILDMSPVDRNLDNKTQTRIQELMLQHGCDVENTLCGDILCRADRVRAIDAKRLAEQMFQAILDALPQLTPIKGIIQK